MSDNKESSVVTRLLEHAQQRPIEASFGEAAKPSRTLTPAMPPAPMPRHRAPAGSVAPPLSSLSTAPGRLAPPALPPPPPAAATAVHEDDLELVDDDDFDPETAKTTEVDQSMIAAVRLLPTNLAPPPLRTASRSGARATSSVEQGLQEMAAHRPLTEDTNPGRRITRPVTAAVGLPLHEPVLSPMMQPSPSVIVAPALVAPAHSGQQLPSVPSAASSTSLPAATASQAQAMSAQALSSQMSLHAGTGVVREPARFRRATPWIAVGAAALLAGAFGALLAMQRGGDAVVAVGPASAPAEAPRIAPVDIALSSIPLGAIIEVADGSTTRELGLTPLTTKLPADGALAITFRREGYAPVTKAFNPKTQRELAVALEPIAPSVGQPSAVPEVAALAAAVEPSPVTKELDAPAPAKSSSKPARRTSRVATSSRNSRQVSVVAAPAGQSATRKGMLSLGAKPPCDILVNGKRTGLVTPQRDMVLPVGSHKITLINKEFGIRESFTVQVEAGREQRVVKDLSKQIKR